MNVTRLVQLTPLLFTLLPSARAATYYVATTGNDTVGTNWLTAKQTIQAAIDLTTAGDIVVVSNGWYATGGRVVNGYTLPNRVAIDRAITVQSVNGPAVTIIEGAGPIGPSAVRCAYVGTNAILSGFTLTYGATLDSGDYLKERSGGGAWCESTAVVTHCILSGNQASEYGGGSYQGSLNRCTLLGNQANQYGGGAYEGTLNNCMMSGNSAGYSGGGSQDGTLHNCTLTGNSAQSGGGVDGGTLYNCIVYFNTATAYIGTDNYDYANFSYSCTTPMPFGGTGNITNAPVFVAPNDFHLLAESPGVNAGNNAYATNSAIDLDGNPRIVAGVVDMGAYESPAVIVTVDAIGGTGRGGGNYLPGENVIISAEGTNAHYSLASWNDGNTNRVRTITVAPTNIAYTATFTQSVAAVTAYVASASTTPVWPYADWSTAATNIQDAIDILVDFDTVIVSNGVYAMGGRAADYQSLTNRVVIDKALLVQSVNGPAVTIIEGAGPIGGSAVRCAYVGYGATLSGFTLTNGATDYSWVGFDASTGGGVWCEYDAVVTNCTLVGNRASEYGGGSYQGELNHCTLTGNQANQYGGGSYGGTLNNCVLTGNWAYGGGGMAAATLYNCTVTGNSASYGGGNNGGWLNNCIVYFNTASSYPNHDQGSFSYSCTTPLPAGGWGNTASPPMFFATNDYHLLASSPCIDEGDYYYGSPTDFDGNPRVVGGVVDMGAYESPYVGVRVVAADGTTAGSGNYLPGTNVLLSVQSTNAHSFFSAWDDGNTNVPRTITVPLTKSTYTAIFTQYVGVVTAYVSLANTNPVWPHTTWDTAATNIHDAMDAVLDGDIVVVSNGVYATGSRTVNGAALPNRVAITKAITVRSLNGRTNTIIQGAGPMGNSAVRCAYVGTNAVLSGFTLTNGATRATAASGAYFQEMGAGGVYCETGAVVTHCTIIRNSADTAAGAYRGTLNNCTLSANGALRWGGGARASTLNHCILSNNWADLQGGGSWQGTLNECTLSGNTAFEEGGGAYIAELNHCTLSGNWAVQGGGTYGGTLNDCTLKNNSGDNNGGGASGGMLNNCLLSGNWAYYGGGSAFASLRNCTLVQNQAEFLGGGSYGDDLKNCIVYLNHINFSPEDPSTNHYNSTLNYSCTAPVYSGTSNIVSNPLFVAWDDFQLKTNSPCIGAGNNAYTNSLTDLKGNPRVVDGTVDLGAYEYQSILIATDPPVLTELTKLGDGTFQFGFTNVTGASFTVLAATNAALPATNWITIGPATETPSGSGQFQFTDPGATNFPQRFYRVKSP